MTPTLADTLAQSLAGAVEEQIAFRDELTLMVSRDHILAALRAAQQIGFVFLTDLTAVDLHPAEPRFEVVYLLTAPEARSRVRLKVRLAGADPTVPSAVAVWPGANWLEREVFDLFGIRFDGHPDLQRILLPDDWEGYPLRKDFSLTEEPVEFIGHTPKVPSQIIPKSPPKQS